MERGHHASVSHVAIFRPILEAGTLPPPKIGRESGTYDFKRKVDPRDTRELAKDVASLANAFGGILLVRAIENEATHTLEEYDPLPLAAAEQIKTAYEQAAAQRCLPQPVIEAVRLEIGPPLSAMPGHVVAVNVRPSPLAPIGVRLDNDSYVFPLRTATHTHYLSPTEFPMLMVAEIRRVAILLDSIPPNQRMNTMLHAETSAGIVDTRAVTVVDVDLTTLTLKPASGGGEIRLPLDRVRSVWRRNEKHWAISVDGKFDVAATGELVLVPK